MSMFSKPWDEKYLNVCIADEIELAKAAGLTRIDCPAAPTRTTPLVAVGKDRLTPARHLPRWRRDWTAAGELIEEFGLSIHQDDEEGSVSVGVRGRRLDVTEKFEDHPDKTGAILAAIVGISTQLRAEQRDNQTDARRRW